ncbi:MAG: biopolymer transporter ExbD [Paludibacteraceae bacterium]|nr:biopolymer transporter ExbD [Paludibacteraceae bacterium]MBR4712617.1 biopolymer transporter ExbD [Paludibacteraceae bacterium]MBR5375433.1 biopolymer transporter ExbD [Paludibacteraceae bacterium]
MKKREIQEINASSMADISFLLLIFFLVTTSMATDKGLFRTLPPPIDPKEQKKTEIEVNTRNLMKILVNSNDKLMVNGEVMDVSRLKEKAKEFIANPANNPDLPEKETVNIPFFGSPKITTKHVISLQNDRGTSYQAYIAVQNELVAAYNELRDEISAKQFDGRKYAQLTEEEQDAVKKYYPLKISEAEPKDYGSKAVGGAQ